MLYIYSEKSLMFKKVTKRILLAVIATLTILVAILLTTTYNHAVGKTRDEVISSLSVEEKLVVVNSVQRPFTEESFVELLKELNVRFPHIVLAQSIVETGHWTSNIFKENHNLFGMKQARVRVNTARGTQYNHAYYDNWRESVYDYAFYQCRYLGSIKTEDEYFKYLSESYAEADGYINILKKVIQKENLVKKFE
jgi:uncharacterized FlgJ-related protein